MKTITLIIALLIAVACSESELTSPYYLDNEKIEVYDIVEKDSIFIVKYWDMRDSTINLRLVNSVYLPNFKRRHNFK